MAWDEPGKKKDDDERDPWSGHKEEDPSKNIEEFLNKFKKNINRIFSGRGGSDDGDQSFSPNAGFFGVGIVFAIIIAIWAVAGFYTVQPAQEAVVLRFGKYLTTQGPGLHWIPRLIDQVYIVDAQKIFTYSYEANMLTSDENIVNIAVSVFYRIENAKDYLFNVANPLDSLQQATASALRQVIGQTNLDNVLTVGREQVRKETQNQLNKILEGYNTGIKVTQVALQQAKAPEEVKAAFDDAIKAQEDEKRYANEAQAYAMRVIPIAQGQAQRIIQEANAYKEQVVLKAQADIAPFLGILPEYKKSPQVTRERLYLDAIEKVLNESTKILIDQSKANNLFYLPIDKLIQSVKENDASFENQDKSQIISSDLPKLPKSDMLPQTSKQQRPGRQIRSQTSEQGDYHVTY